MKLSNTKIDLYKACRRKFKLHYLDKIRGENTFSPLVFGKSIDEALNILLLQKKKELTEEELAESQRNPFIAFDDAFKIAEINGDFIDVRHSTRIEYYKSDCDLTTLVDNDFHTISNVEYSDLVKIDKNNVEDFVEECQTKFKNKLAISEQQVKLYNFICWLSLRRKGHLFIKEYMRMVIPHIVEVHTIQRQVSLPNGSGDEIVGYIDFEATFDDGIRRVIDNKTASVAYKDDSVKTSQQLTIYSEFAENRQCGYIVMVKKLRKKEPKVRIQMLFDEIPEEQFEKVFETVGEVENGIKNGQFEQNFDNCFAYGKPCIYFKYCRGENAEGLVKVDKEEKK